MTTYTVHFATHASAWAKVEAEDVDAAIELAYNEVYVSLCHQCAHDVEVGDDFEATAAFNEETGECEWQEGE